MKAVMRQLEEINRVKEAINKTDSPYLKLDYKKNLKRLKKDLREYCYYRGLSYREIIGE